MVRTDKKLTESAPPAPRFDGRHAEGQALRGTRGEPRRTGVEGGVVRRRVGGGEGRVAVRHEGGGGEDGGAAKRLRGAGENGYGGWAGAG
jgi:hypothetical protein